METEDNLTVEKLIVARPRFYFGFDADEMEIWLSAANDVVYGFVQDFTCSFQDGYRHISISELNGLMQLDDNIEKRRVLAEIFMAYLFEKGVDLRNHNWRCGLWVNEGIKREGEDLIIFKNIDGKLECLTEATYDMTIGYKLKGEFQSQLESRRFNIERFFRKYNRSNESPTLKQIDKANPDLIEYLFEQEYENLSLFIQNAKFLFPPDVSENRKETWKWGESDIWPLSLDISIFKTAKEEKEALSDLPYFSSREDVCHFIFKEATIYPYQLSCGLHIAVKD